MINRYVRSSLKVIGSVAAVTVMVPQVLFADAPPPERFEERIPVDGRRKEAPVMQEKKEMTKQMSEDGWLVGFAPGLNVLFFDCEDTEVAPAFYVDVRKTDIPVNLRLGVEGTKISGAEQFQFNPQSQYFNDKPDFTFIRIPLSLEYVLGVAEGTDVMVGGGPDLVVVSDDASDTTVGWHVGARVEQALSDDFAVSAGGGYLWAEPEEDGEDIDLDSAYVGANVTYKLGF